MKLLDKFKASEEKKKFTTSEIILLVIMSLLIGLSFGLIFKDNNIMKNQLIEDKHINEFIENYNYIIDNYYMDVDKEKLINGAISGMMESLEDPHSVYLDESESNNFSITLNGSYQGIGIQIYKDEETGYILITNVFKDTPAANAKLKIGDIIISLDGKDVKAMTSNEFTSIIRESKKKEFEFKVLRDEEELKVTLNKTNIELDSVTSKTYDIDDKKVGYIYIGIFANNTYTQFKQNLEKLEKENISYLIIDVRGNTGGHLTTVDEMLDLFLNSKQIMYQFEKNNKKTSVYGKNESTDKKEYEIILLGDSSSASASEVLIAGLKENLNSKFFGTKTYGKGTVQEMVTLSDGTKYKMTTKKWLTPKGNWINETEGIKPDIEIKLDEKYFETYEEDDDNQLQEVLEYIKNR